MARLFDAIESRFAAVLEQARGQSGLGTLAAARYIPTGRFRRAGNKAALDDAAYPVQEFDAAYDLTWLGLQDTGPDPANPLDGQTLRLARVTLRVGYVYGKGSTAFVDTAAGDTASAVVLQNTARQRALSDAERIYRAVAITDIFDSTTTDPQWQLMRREGATTVADLGGGRLLSSTTYVLLLTLDASSAYDP